MTYKCKPFNLQAALNGDKFARLRDMKEPEEFHYFKSDRSGEKFICYFGGQHYWYNDYGKNSSDSQDLVMIIPVKKLWIAIAKKPFASNNRYDVEPFSYPEKEMLIARIESRDHCNNPNDYHFIEIELEN